MFDLKKSIDSWKRTLRKHETFEDGMIVDLESHLRDAIDSLKSEGMHEEEAFREAVKRVGADESLAAECGKVREYRFDLRSPWRPSRFMPTLLGYYLKFAWRRMRLHKGYAFLNVAGLALGMACSLLILLWVRDELSFDRFHKNAASLYRVVQNIHFTDHETTWAITQGPLGPVLASEVPEIAEAARFGWWGTSFEVDGQRFSELLGMADGSFLSIFSFPLLEGDPKTALEDPRSILLTEEMVRKYFPKRDPLGQTLRTVDGFEFRITGVLHDIPLNSHVRFDFLVPFVFGRELNYSVDTWNNSQFTTYVRLQPGISVADALSKIEHFLDDKPTLEKDARLALQPLTAIHLHSHYEYDLPHGSIQSVRIFSLAAFVILLIACINFMNLTTARSANRAREVGLRKVSGAQRGHLVRLFYGEALVMSGGALVLALGLIRIALPPFSRLAGKELGFDLLASPDVLAGLAGLVLAVALLAGSYPSFYLSRFRPAAVLRGTLSSGSGGRGLRKSLVVFQFTLTALLLIGTLFIVRQLYFLRGYDLGYDKKNVVMAAMSGEIKTQYEAVRVELLRDPRIRSVSATSSLPTTGYWYSHSLWKWEGQNPNEEILMRGSFCDIGYYDVLGLKLLAGRDFVKVDNPVVNPQWIINEEAARVMNLEHPVGQTLSDGTSTGPIVGLVKNHNFTSLRRRIEPLIMAYLPQLSRILLVKLNGNDVPGVLGSIESVLNKIDPAAPFNYRFLDEEVDRLYRAEERIGTIFGLFAGLAVLVSCLGLLGLAAFLAEQKTKEIGIRKVLGASASGIIIRFTRQFALWVLAANLIAEPIAFFGVSRWLRDYAYRIPVGPGPFLAVGGLSLFIALLVVGTQCSRAAYADPVRSLRYE